LVPWSSTETKNVSEFHFIFLPVTKNIETLHISFHISKKKPYP